MRTDAPASLLYAYIVLVVSLLCNAERIGAAPRGFVGSQMCGGECADVERAGQSMDLCLVLLQTAATYFYLPLNTPLCHYLRRAFNFS